MSEAAFIEKSDAEIVGAIRQGDREQYRELVERHATRVFGIAWSRLGDHSLAEEAAQEAFVQAYKRLGLLRDAQRFGGWLATIARNVAINLGIRHRREMEKRERWKLEQGALADSGASPDEGPWTAETLQESLAKLPPIHRETLVAFYIDRKSVAEAAEGLGISETAFKTRLHRARESLRSALEEKLEASLETLRPSSKFAAGVMLALPAQAPGSALGGGALALLSKLLPAGWFFFCLQFVSIIPTLFFARWLLKKERENFRDPGGLRARNLDQMRRTATWFVPFLILAVTLGLRPFDKATAFSILLAIVVVPALIWSARRAVLVRSRQAFAEFALCLVLAGFCVVMQLGWPTYWIFFANALMLGMNSFILQHRPSRMDYSLFLRAAENPGAAPETERRSYSRPELFRFARFLAERQLAIDWRWAGDALELKLAPVTPKVWLMWLPLLWRGSSILSISSDGEAAARAGSLDRSDLRKLGSRHEPAELETRVARNLAAALSAFSLNRMDDATRLIWEESEDRIFHKPPSRTLSTRAIVWSHRVLAVLTFAGAIYMRFDYFSGGSQSLELVRFTEAEFRAQLEARLVNAKGTNIYFEGPSRSPVLPEARFISPAASNALRALLQHKLALYPATNPVQRATDFFLGDELFHRAFLSGLVPTNDFDQFGISLEEVRREIRSWPDWRKKMHLATEPLRLGQLGYSVFATATLSQRLAVLSATGFLEEFDLSEVASAIARRQIIAEREPEDYWRDLDPKQLRGLFLMIQSNPLRDTYDVLCVLERLGALDSIDREECIRGLLRFHLGRGLFKKNDRGAVNWHIRGDAIDTFCVFESLRILSALDRVKDLEKWQFRSARYRRKEGAPPPWEAVNAYALRRRAMDRWGGAGE